MQLAHEKADTAGVAARTTFVPFAGNPELPWWGSIPICETDFRCALRKAESVCRSLEKDVSWPQNCSIDRGTQLTVRELGLRILKSDRTQEILARIERELPGSTTAGDRQTPPFRQHDR